MNVFSEPKEKTIVIVHDQKIVIGQHDPSQPLDRTLSDLLVTLKGQPDNTLHLNLALTQRLKRINRNTDQPLT